MIRDPILFLIFTLDELLVLLQVATRTPVVSDPRPFMVSCVDDPLKLNLSEVNSSRDPSSLVRIYLPAVNGRKVKSVPDCIAFV